MGSILVVEDDEDLAMLVAGVIADEGHDVRVAMNGREALDLVAQHMPDLILLDLRMPIMNGKDFVAHFDREYGRAARIVAMTAADNAAVRAREVGADAWLAKPFLMQEVVQLVDAHVPTARCCPPAAR
jgi:DNA-binding response OmpR family regulator